MNYADLKRRKDLVLLLNCYPKLCKYRSNDMCTHDNDCVDKNGYPCCPLNWKAIKRSEFKG